MPPFYRRVVASRIGGEASVSTAALRNVLSSSTVRYDSQKTLAFSRRHEMLPNAVARCYNVVVIIAVGSVGDLSTRARLPSAGAHFLWLARFGGCRNVEANETVGVEASYSGNGRPYSWLS
ncbi:hypothetical protein ISCGN_011334 [Ixodes scapularis]